MSWAGRSLVPGRHPVDATGARGAASTAPLPRAEEMAGSAQGGRCRRPRGLAVSGTALPSEADGITRLPTPGRMPRRPDASPHLPPRGPCRGKAEGATAGGWRAHLTRCRTPFACVPPQTRRSRLFSIPSPEFALPLTVVNEPVRLCPIKSGHALKAQDFKRWSLPCRRLSRLPERLP